MSNIQSDKDITIDKDILKVISLNSKIQRSDLRIYLFLLSLDRPVYQKELIKLAKEKWVDIENLGWLNNEEGNKIKCVSDFRTEVICRAIKTLTDFRLVKVAKKEGNNKFIEVEKDINTILFG
ncbi:hypothetical protein [uncultured Clostridium sp.]|nr:hypothetical protein [uncultured Clostridium sp.]